MVNRMLKVVYCKDISGMLNSSGDGALFGTQRYSTSRDVGGGNEDMRDGRAPSPLKSGGYFRRLCSHAHRIAFSVEGALNRRHRQIKDAGSVDSPKEQRKQIHVEHAGEHQDQSDRRKQER
jgi:hypothetical protein